ncbi:toxin HicA [Synechocystis salina]|uniref:Toxin HicA n=1 Tax=Synechocystis salina LEGE 00031 TaxID=1828736 RepID=A0ABR9VUN2_9SYNC|nr:toxin HicA [Synechocystis salina]MBE9242955.1 toxin HicA [Synechocystis salina LEGE 00041]MBE9255073.1 toxin HicA [Synechocystis salina LEGE 00031]
MTSVAKLVAQFKNQPNDVRFTDLVKVCNHYFGEPRQQGTSHCIYKTPWQGDPRINIQDKKGKAKPYQVKQVLAAIEKLEDFKNG